MEEDKGPHLKAHEAAHQVLEFIDKRVPELRSRPEQVVRQFAAAGLMRCCALLRGILTLDEAGMTGLAGILARQHWETWLVSLYVLLGGDDAVQVVAGDDIHWKRRLSGALKLNQDYHPNWPGRIEQLNYRVISERVLELLRQHGEPVTAGGVTGYDVTYRVQSLFAVHANIATITAHIAYGPDEWTVMIDTPPLVSDVAITPVLP